jgi:hypothetical protein
MMVALVKRELEIIRRNSALAWVAAAVLSCACMNLAPGSALAEPADAAVQLGLLAPVQTIGEERSITHLRLSLLHGANRDVRGFDLSGIATETRGDFLGGLQISVVNEVMGNCSGLQIGLMGSDVRGRLHGAQISGLVSHAGDGSGMQMGLFFTEAKKFTGFQLALFNRAEEMKGLQIGLINFNPNGFLPVFPIFNYGR